MRSGFLGQTEERKLWRERGQDTTTAEEGRAVFRKMREPLRPTLGGAESKPNAATGEGPPGGVWALSPYLGWSQWVAGRRLEQQEDLPESPATTQTRKGQVYLSNLSISIFLLENQLETAKSTYPQKSEGKGQDAMTVGSEEGLEGKIRLRRGDLRKVTVMASVQGRRQNHGKMSGTGMSIPFPWGCSWSRCPCDPRQGTCLGSPGRFRNDAKREMWAPGACQAQLKPRKEQGDPGTFHTAGDRARRTVTRADIKHPERQAPPPGSPTCLCTRTSACISQQVEMDARETRTCRTLLRTAGKVGAWTITQGLIGKNAEGGG